MRMNCLKMIRVAIRNFGLAVAAGILLPPVGNAAEPSALEADAHGQAYDADPLGRTYRRLLPLEGGSNFRDIGGYRTRDGRLVKRGLLFRSGAPTALTQADFAYLSQFQFKEALDLRSREERELFPNHWVQSDRSVAYKFHDYSIAALMESMRAQGKRSDMEELYRTFPQLLAPQLKIYFKALLNYETPIVVYCSAGQDRTGFTAALVLSLLDVPRDVIVEDYLLSTDFRRPDRELGDVDLQAASAENDFAKMMLAYHEPGVPRRPNPLVTDEGTPFIEFALNQVEEDFGSAEGYLSQVLGLSQADVERLRSLYLVDESA